MTAAVCHAVALGRGLGQQAGCDYRSGVPVRDCKDFLQSGTSTGLRGWSRKGWWVEGREDLCVCVGVSA